MQRVNTLRSLVLAGAISLALSGCGGGSSDPVAQTPTTPQVPASTISGIAAVGAPLSGTVTIKDAAGATKTVTIGSNGSYTVDVTGMTAPFVFRASGTANGQTYTVHSAAASADINGTINITQLTELMLDNIAGQLASNYFDSGNFSSVSKATLDAEAARLKEKLLPVLTALGVASSVDLLRTQFTPLSSALDSALDIISVSVDATTNKATITNIVTQQKLEDDILVSAAGEASPAQMTETAGVADAPSDVTLVKAALTSFAAKFATGLPSQASLLSALSTDYLNDDADGSSSAADMSSDPSLVGAQFADVDVTAIDYTDPAGATARVNFTIKDANGIEQDRTKNFWVRKGLVDGVWRLAGNHRMLSAEGHVHTVRSLRNPVCTMTGLEFLIEDLDDTNNGGIEVDHFMVYGPGLPGTGASGALRYNPPDTGGYWKLANQATPYFVMGNSCQGSQPISDARIAAIPDNASYLIVAYSSTDNTVRVNFPSGAIKRPGEFADGAYVVTLDKRPLTLAEAVASTQFPTIVAPTLSAFDTYTSGPLSISLSNMNPKMYADVRLQQNTVGNDFRDVDTWLAPTSGGLVSTTLSLTAAAPGDAITSRGFFVETQDSYRRTMMTIY
jgi:hypothetical protein